MPIRQNSLASITQSVTTISDATDPTQPATLRQTLELWRAINVNLLATGQTTLVAVNNASPTLTGLSFIPHSAYIELTAVTGVLTVPIIRIGNSVNFDNIAPLLTCTGLTTVRNMILIPLVGSLVSVNINTAAIKVDVQTAGLVASVATANIYLYGVLR